MERISVLEAARDFSGLVDRVASEGVSFELARDNDIVARLTPAGPRSKIKVADLNVFLGSLPVLGDDAKAFSADVREIRHAFPVEVNPWD